MTDANNANNIPGLAANSASAPGVVTPGVVTPGVATPGVATPTAAAAAPAATMDQGTYEIIRSRLNSQGQELQRRLDTLNVARKATFGTIDMQLLATERITTANNCTPRDMVAIGDRFIFGYNVFIGLKSETRMEDVFAIYHNDGASTGGTTFKEESLDLLDDPRFHADFKELYRYYKTTLFVKFAIIGTHLFMVFQVGKAVTDIKTFKWLVRDNGKLQYIDNRSEHECRLPSQHEFEWTRTHRDLHRSGMHPHISINDKIFVETVGGDLTIKVEDNTATGEGIFSEPVENRDQTLDDAEIFYASIGPLILLKIKPYQEKDYRHIVFSEKIRRATRVDALATACVLLPDDHGIIFPRGYCLQTGEYKEFDTDLPAMQFEKRIASPNGEDTLYVFHSRVAGVYVLLSYNIIAQRVDTPVVCGGFSLFEDGRMILFKEHGEARKHHAIQVWQTPFVGANYVPPKTPTTDSFLFKVGNRDIVRCMAECREVLTLIGKDDSYANLFLDLTKKAGDIVDSYFWVDKAETGNLREPLLDIKAAAASAVDEHEKVMQVKRETREAVGRTQRRLREVVQAIFASPFNSIEQYVTALTNLRTTRGEVIGLKELRYIDLALVAELEREIDDHHGRIAQKCLEYLLTAEALDPYRRRVDEIGSRVPQLVKVTVARTTETDAVAAANELEMLIDVISNLEFDDVTARTEIIDRISTIFASLNQVRSALKNKVQELAKAEGIAEFGAQMKLLNQAVVNFLDLADTPEKCDELLTKVMVQVEEQEGRFADFEQFVTEIGEKREEIVAAFEARKIALVETRARRANTLVTTAERVLKGIRGRAATFREATEILGYFAADLMVDKVRGLIKQLIDLGDSVKADDLESRLKTAREDALRQLRDRQELFVGGENVIKFGRHQFSVNTQPLDLTLVPRDDGMFLHLTGTNFFEAVTDEAFLSTRASWKQELVSETADVYRSEYLAWQVLQALETATTAGPGAATSFTGAGPTQPGTTAPAPKTVPETPTGRDDPDDPAQAGSGMASDDAVVTLAQARRFEAPQWLAHVQKFMGPRYGEGYVRGVHDHDAARILGPLVEMHAELGLLRYSPAARAMAWLFWTHFRQSAKSVVAAKMRGAGLIGRMFPGTNSHTSYVEELRTLLARFVAMTSLFPESLVEEAAQYLFDVQSRDDRFAVSGEAVSILHEFHACLNDRNMTDAFASAIGAVGNNPVSAFGMLRDWVQAFLGESGSTWRRAYRDEVATLLFGKALDEGQIAGRSCRTELTGMVGNHRLVEGGRYQLDYLDLSARMREFARVVVPRFNTYTVKKQELLEKARTEMRLDEFKAKVLSSFVRNQLIDKVYLPLIGDNLAKQIGTVGDTKRTDRSGMLLLISPPGYGKTTLMEYLANRLGLVFMKINGPSIGRRVTSFDPAEAANAAARAELEKLNLAFEMGDNVMIYVDDIQHCSPEFLEKFISLCDAQRKVEGVYRRRSRTYDFRGRKVAVVMAGNPYTESGERFKLPDMLANRADTYNLGDIIGDNRHVFELSYLENAVTSNPVLARINAVNPADVAALIKIAATGSRDGVEFAGNHSPAEINDAIGVMQRMMKVRDVVLTVNREYIRSAAQSEAYRVEPEFKMQGSYRNMNRIAEKILPIMNERELATLIASHYEGEAQTLTTAAESNLLKFKELCGTLTDTDRTRWESIKATFKKNVNLKGFGGNESAQLMAQLGAVSDGLTAIKEALLTAASNVSQPVTFVTGSSLGGSGQPESPRTPGDTVAKTTAGSITADPTSGQSSTPARGLKNVGSPEAGEKWVAAPIDSKPPLATPKKGRSPKQDK